MIDGTIKRRLLPGVALGVTAAAAGVAIGHWAWTSSSPSAPRTTANRTSPNHSQPGDGNYSFGPGGGLQFRRHNGSCTYTIPGGGSFSFSCGAGNFGNNGGGFSYSGPGGSFSSPGYSGGAQNSNGVSSAITGKVNPGLVDINTVLVNNEGNAAGTGMVVSPSGEVFTNNHVIAGATKITATDVGNGKTYTARVVGYDHHHDIAVLQLVGASGLKTVTLGDSSTLKNGQMVATIGNAGGIGGTPSADPGQITGTGQSITAQDAAAGTQEHLSNLIGLNGNLQPGDSGGPLVNSRGQVVGMDTAASSTFVFQGGSDQGFAIPINYVKSVAAQIRAGRGSAAVHIGATGFIGILVCSPGGNLCPTPAADVQSGAVIDRVLANTPASTSGLAAADTITALDGTKVTTPQDLTNLVLLHHPGDTVTFTYTTSSGASQTTSVKLASGPSQ
jgi:S1-C subfamily serine protease